MPPPRPANDAAPDEVRMTADLPTARVEIAHRAEAGEEVITMTLRAQPSLDAATGLFGPAAAAAMLSLGAPMKTRDRADGPEFADPMRLWADAWAQWMSLCVAPWSAAFGGPTLCGPGTPPGSSKTKKS